MTTDDYINVIKNKSLPRATRLNALNYILRIPAPGALKQLLDDDRFLNVIVFDIHEYGAASQLFYLIYQAFDLND